MNIKDVRLSGENSFTLESGRLLVADAYYLGYSNEVLDEIGKQGSNTRKRVVYIPNGAIYTYPEDSLWNVYRKENGLWIARQNSDAVERDIHKKHFGPAGFMLPFSDEEFAERDEKLKAINQDLKNNGFLFWASTDICTLLLGDQRIFGLDENEFDFSHQLDRHEEIIRRNMTYDPKESLMTSSYNPYIGDKKPTFEEPDKPLDSASLDHIRTEREEMESYYRSVARENQGLVAEIEPGEYSCKSKWNGLEVNLL